MKHLFLFSLFFLFSCAHEKTVVPETNISMASDSIALGNVRATAIKSIESERVCFDITLYMKGVDAKEAMSSNWTLAWIDESSRYHLLTLNQREPAAIPYGAYKEWENHFRTCAPKDIVRNVKSLVLTPKELSYPETEGLTLEWK